MAPSASATLLSGSGTGLDWILSVLIPKARSLAEVLNTNFEISAVSLLIPKNCAELSSACEEVPGIEKLPNKVLLLSNAAIEPTKLGVPFTAICAPALNTGCSKAIVKGPELPMGGNAPGVLPVNKIYRTYARDI